jgi:hypothetical protein
MQNEERCYKPGRDLFQLLISVWCKKEIRLRMNESFIKKIDSILCYEGHDYSKILELNSDSKWPYSLTMDDNFDNRNDQLPWCEKYRAINFEDVYLPDVLEHKFKNMRSNSKMGISHNESVET